MPVIKRATPWRSIDLDESEEEVVGAQAVLMNITLINLAASVRYVKVYDAEASDVTVGDTTPTLTIPVPTQGDTNGSGVVFNFGPTGMQFSNGITLAATTALADNDSGAPGDNEIVAIVGYVS